MKKLLVFHLLLCVLIYSNRVYNMLSVIQRVNIRSITYAILNITYVITIIIVVTS